MTGNRDADRQKAPALIIFRKYSLQIKEDAGSFHWLVTLRKTLEPMIVGEQMTYQAAFDEGERWILAMQSDETAGEFLQQAASA